MSTVEQEEAGGEARLAQRRPRMVAAMVTIGALALFEIAVIRVAGGRGAVPDPEPPPALALPAPKAAPRAMAAGVRRQPFLPPLAAEAAADPGHGPLFTPDLAEVAPLAGAPAAPVAAPAPPPTPVLAADEHVVPEPPPSEAQPLEIDLPTPVPVRLELDGSCPRVALGPFRLGLRCRR